MSQKGLLRPKLQKATPKGPPEVAKNELAG
jgi:hypothetical protein